MVTLSSFNSTFFFKVDVLAINIATRKYPLQTDSWQPSINPFTPKSDLIDFTLSNDR